MSAICNFVSTYRTEIVLLRTNERKWWYFNAICLVRDLIFGTLTRSMHPLLSSKTVQWTVGMVQEKVKTGCNSCRSPIRGMTSRSDCDRAMYSLSVVERAISVCSFDDQMIGQFAQNITYPVRDITDDGSSLHDVFQSPANDASTYVSIIFVLLGLNSIPCGALCLP